MSQNNQDPQTNGRIIDLLERIGSIFLYHTTSLTQKDIAKKLHIGNDRITEILKGVEKTK